MVINDQERFRFEGLKCSKQKVIQFYDFHARDPF